MDGSERALLRGFSSPCCRRFHVDIFRQCPGLALLWRRRLVGSAIVAVSSSIAFCGWVCPVVGPQERMVGACPPFVEIVSLTVVYVTTIFFIVLAALTTISNIFGAEFGQYLVRLVGGWLPSAVYFVSVQEAS